MSQKRKTVSGKERAGGGRVTHTVESTATEALPSTAALLTDCILPGIQGEPAVSPGRSRPDTCLLRGALAEVAAPLAIGPIESLSATATENRKQGLRLVFVSQTGPPGQTCAATEW